jgi:hypothetical protein
MNNYDDRTDLATDTDETDGDPIGWTIVSTGDGGSVLCESPSGNRRRYWFHDRTNGDQITVGLQWGESSLEATWISVISSQLLAARCYVVGPGLAPPTGYTTAEHIAESDGWDDQLEALRWAAENGATVAEMRAWRRMRHGEDLVVSE